MNKTVFKKRLEKIWDWMVQEEIAMTMFEDAEGKRDATIRWLSGHPFDSLLFLSAERKSVIVPWDVNMALAYAYGDYMMPYNQFNRDSQTAVDAVADILNIPSGAKIEIPAVTPYPVFLDFIESFPSYDIICRKECTGSYAKDLRIIKDDDEIALLRRAADITNKIINLIEKKVRDGKIKTEADAAILIELESRKYGCEGTSFETLAAGQDRSFGIHAFPSWTNAPFGGKGLSILDFGLRYHGYCTDVTLTFVRDASPAQLKMVGLVEKAAKTALEQLVNGNDIAMAAAAVDKLFKKSKKSMDHGLGHGIGLDVHENPIIKSNSAGKWILAPGMVFSVEPGLYDPVHGGCRLENDILMTETGYEILTKARIIWL